MGSSLFSDPEHLAAAMRALEKQRITTAERMGSAKGLTSVGELGAFDLGITAEQFAAYTKRREGRRLEAARELYAMEWFLHLDMGYEEHVRVAELARESPEQANQYLADFYAERLDAIEADVCAKWPDRAEVLHDAFWAHREGKHTLSIPTMIAQSDGIAREAFGYELFRTNPRLNKLMDGLYGPDGAQATVLDVFLELLRDTSGPFRKDVMPSDAPGEHLRRHAILHGNDSTYNSELNGLKAVSLLSFVATSVPFIIESNVKAAERRKEIERERQERRRQFVEREERRKATIEENRAANQRRREVWERKTRAAGTDGNKVPAPR